MKLLKCLLLGSAAALVNTVGAQAADLPTRESGPIDYVRVCDAYGAGFFYIPGTETCLKVGGLALTEVRSYDASFSVSPVGANGNATGLGASTSLAGSSALNPFAPFVSTAAPGGLSVRQNGGASAFGYIPTGSQYANSSARDKYGWDSLGRVELDARSGTPWGTLRTFIRVDAYVGTGTANTGALTTGSSYIGSNTSLYNTAAGNGATRETTIVNKAFIQFAGLTAGRAQSMFDFYASAYNYQNIAGSNATTQLIAYTALLDNIYSGLSATLSVEDQNARQAAIGSTLAGTYGFTATKAGVITNTQSVINVGGINGTSFVGTPGGTALPDIVGNLRVDEPWGTAQLSAAGHQARGNLYASAAYPTIAATTVVYSSDYAFPANTTNSYGWAVQGGLELKTDYISAGDKLWLQAAYERGALSYVWGNNLASSYGAVNGNRFYGSGYTPADTSAGWNTNLYDCIFTASGYCEQQTGWSVVAAYKHYWLPTLASAVFGSYAQINYSDNALAGFGGAVGVSNLKTARIGTNLVWTPLKGFDIGAELMYVNVKQSRPVGLAPDVVLNNNGLPSWRGSENEYEGRIRVQRAF